MTNCALFESTLLN